jgi:site-specific DNA-methyltransferase (adenine-specific)
MQIIHGDCLDWLADCGRYDMIFADPPDNIGLKYEEYKDNNPNYYHMIECLMHRAMLKCNVLWISYYWRHDLEFKYIARNLCKAKVWNAKTFIWRYTFGQHNKSDCGSGFRYLLRLASPVWRPSVEGIRVQSVRQAIGDRRASPQGRVPDDVWCFDTDGVWDEWPRVVGNSEQRRTWHPTQHPEGLMERIVKLSGAKTVLDCFLGSGTTMRVCQRLGVDCDGVEIVKSYVEKVKGELNVREY